MRMVTASRGPRPFLLQLQLLLQCTAFALAFTATNAFAQDRVILFESFVRLPNNTLLNGELREVQITEGGRRWSVVRTLSLPPHNGGTPVALADGSRIAWLVFVGDSKRLAQYDTTTGRASLVDIGLFDRNALLVSDPLVPRLYVIEPARVIFIDYRLQRLSIVLSGTKDVVFAQATGSNLIVHRRFPDDVVVIDTNTAAITNIITFGELSVVRASRHGRLYRYYRTLTPPLEDRIESLSLANGALIARTLGNPFTFFELDDARGVIIHDGVDPFSGRSFILARDATALSVIGEFAPGVFNSRYHFELGQTTSRTVLMSSRELGPSYLTPCSQEIPRIDVFDATTLVLVNRIDLQGRCPTVISLPPR